MLVVTEWFWRAILEFTASFFYLSRSFMRWYWLCSLSLFDFSKVLDTLYGEMSSQITIDWLNGSRTIDLTAFCNLCLLYKLFRYWSVFYFFWLFDSLALYVASSFALMFYPYLFCFSSAVKGILNTVIIWV